MDPHRTADGIGDGAAGCLFKGVVVEMIDFVVVTMISDGLGERLRYRSRKLQCRPPRLSPELPRSDHTCRQICPTLFCLPSSARMEIRGTPMYIAPESATRKEYRAAADIWAFGCTAVEMISGRSPWQCTDQSEMGIWGLLMRIGSDDELPEIPPTMSEEGKDFLRRCFVKDPNNRWTAEMLLSHSFVDLSSASKIEKEDIACSARYRTPMSVLGVSFSPVQSTFDGTKMLDLVLLEEDEDWARERIRAMASEEGRPNWASCSPEDGMWITVREASTSDRVEYEDALRAEKISDASGLKKGLLSERTKYYKVNL
ncbi:Mitogen-activated protein kinase kinase kinase YODA [Dendrobium catenatum]|uniref:Mitogen-activated protein kinase kinase kinase YODA n=1 Tax=Dendrobium catenatum TaxID=906689 RepID=A0A2I0VG19_9ASPA|nr:Mitogen-activated protein kinase kinase kinase YODA [Dendrobium catenatum]